VTVRKIERMATGRASIKTIRIIRRSPCATLSSRQCIKGRSRRSSGPCAIVRRTEKPHRGEQRDRGTHAPRRQQCMVLPEHCAAPEGVAPASRRPRSLPPSAERPLNPRTSEFGSPNGSGFWGTHRVAADDLPRYPQSAENLIRGDMAGWGRTAAYALANGRLQPLDHPTAGHTAYARPYLGPAQSVKR
jgi:hypothetical protein